MRIDLSRREIIVFYLVIAGLDLLFIIASSPLLQGSVTEGQMAAQFNSIADFIAYHLDLKNERNIATWYSSAILLLAGIMALLNSRTAPASLRLRRAYQLGWIALALVLIGLAADETAMIHEVLAPMLNFLNRGDRAAQVRVGVADWVPLLLPFIIIVAAGMILFFWLIRSNRKRFALLAFAGVLCWAGAIWTEAVEGKLLKLDMSRAVGGMIEEGFEIIGTSLLLFAFMEFHQARQSAGELEYSGKAKSVGKRAKRLASS